MNRASPSVFVVLLGASVAIAQTPLSFTAHTVATDLRGGYQVVPADLNRDGKLDLIAVASNLRELAWFENPSWTRHVLAGGFTGLINAAAADLDGDGIPEVAVAHGFATTPDRSIGNLSLLTHGADVNAPWTIREIDRVPTTHRVRWYTPSGSNEKWLVNAPLVGATARAPEYRGATPIYVYRPPDFVRGVLSEIQEGVVHALEIGRSGPSGSALYVAGFLGVTRYQFADGRWGVTPIGKGDPAPWPTSGSSEIGTGMLGTQPFFATIEPWHGTKVVVYRGASMNVARQVIDSTITDGHTLVVADFDGDGHDEIVAGERGGARGLRIYRANGSGDTWTRTMLDEGGMAAASCAAVDLNADKKLDLVCIGTATANLKWYENRG